MRISSARFVNFRCFWDLSLQSGDHLTVMDEVDLHLHPSWQQRILPELRARFVGVDTEFDTACLHVENEEWRIGLMWKEAAWDE